MFLAACFMILTQELVISGPHSWWFRIEKLPGSPWEGISGTNDRAWRKECLHLDLHLFLRADPGREGALKCKEFLPKQQKTAPGWWLGLSWPGHWFQQCRHSAQISLCLAPPLTSARTASIWFAWCSSQSHQSLDTEVQRHCSGTVGQPTCPVGTHSLHFWSFREVGQGDGGCQTLPHSLGFSCVTS